MTANLTIAPGRHIKRASWGSLKRALPNAPRDNAKTREEANFQGTKSFVRELDSDPRNHRFRLRYYSAVRPGKTAGAGANSRKAATSLWMTSGVLLEFAAMAKESC